ncbi:MAG: HEAT repeat domain-containing protein [wastewater metagenome]|nr:HEAT repeat domain-containing protein [Candidatus Loosdrechtia aerotolerans]
MMLTLYRIIKICAYQGSLATLISLSVFLYSHYQILLAETLSDQGILEIKLSDGRLSAKVRNSPLKDVLEEVMEQGKSRIWVHDSIQDTTVTVEFENLPVSEGIHKIMKDKNYVFIYAPAEVKEGTLSLMDKSSSGKSDISYKRQSDPFPETTEAPHTRYSLPIDNMQNEKSSFESLVRNALESEREEEREEAVIALGESMDKKAIEVLSKVLVNDPDEDIRLSAIDALLTIGDSSVVPSLAAGLKDKRSVVRESVVEALGAIGGEAALELIKGVMNDEDEYVRGLAKEIINEYDTYQ